MNINDIKKISLVEFLNQLGYQPTGRDSKGLWFYAPYRSERKPSFHVNPRKNVWFDFGSGDGGDIFTLAGELCDSTDFIRQAEYIAEKMQMPIAKPYKPEPFIEQPTFEDVKISKKLFKFDSIKFLWQPNQSFLQRPLLILHNCVKGDGTNQAMRKFSRLPI